MISPYDEALDLLHGIAPEYGDGLSNHGPMLAAALGSLQRSEETEPWVRRYCQLLEPSVEATEVITRQSWKGALSDRSRYRDWAIFYGKEIGQLGWDRVVKEWVPRLVPGLSGAAGHGLVRTAYAISQLELRANELRLAELASALAYWSVSYQKLPGITAPSIDRLSPLAAIGRIKWMHKGEATPDGLIGEELTSLNGYPPFTGVINLVELPDDPQKIIGDLVDVSARLLLAHKPFDGTLIPFLHGSILSTSMRHLMPHLKEEDNVRLVQYGWQFVGAMIAIYGQINPQSEIEPPSDNIAQLIDKAISSGDVHAVIAVDLCLQELRVKPQESLLAATWEVVDRLTPLPAELSEEPDPSENPTD